ncbi:MAG: DUF4434 domain-containing protein [Bacteroidales bacterium]|nr:DUF4434 domain-containing protein [Bacteroidales bacterium]
MMKRDALFLLLAALLAAGLPLRAQVKLVDSCETDGWEYSGGAGKDSSGASLTRTIEKGDCVEGEGCFRFTYGFGGGKGPGEESVYWQRLFTNFRCDFSFRPKSISVWVKGDPGNKGDLRIVLLQGDMTSSARHKILRTYGYTDRKALRSSGWKKVEAPFGRFKPLGGEDVPLDLSQVIGWRIEVVNTDGTVSEGNVFEIDKMEQNTSYKPRRNREARLGSLIIQLNKKLYADTDWEEVFNATKSIGIDSWLIQFSIGRKNAWHVAFYKNCTLPWVREKLDYMDKMFAAAEKCGVKLTVGPAYEPWGATWDLFRKERYDDVFAANRLVIDDIAASFASSPAFAGWYIANEFHDGSKSKYNWWEEEANTLLAEYLERTASYMKSLKDVPVCISPALFRGFPAKMTGDMYDRLFSLTPSVDRLYIQDCAGRGADMITSVGVDLPNYFAELKKACEKHGVKFCVNAESFFRCDILNEKRRPKTWDEFRRQLEVAGAFTDEITSFSWFSFQPGQETWEGYKKYISR